MCELFVPTFPVPVRVSTLVVSVVIIPFTNDTDDKVTGLTNCTVSAGVAFKLSKVPVSTAPFPLKRSFELTVAMLMDVLVKPVVFKFIILLEPKMVRVPPVDWRFPLP